MRRKSERVQFWLELMRTPAAFYIIVLVAAFLLLTVGPLVIR